MLVIVSMNIIMRVLVSVRVLVRMRVAVAVIMPIIVMMLLNRIGAGQPQPQEPDPHAHHKQAAGHREPGINAVQHYVVGCEQSQEAEDENARRVGDRYHRAQVDRVSYGAPRANQIGRHERLAMAGREAVGRTEEKRYSQGQQHKLRPAGGHGEVPLQPLALSG